MTKKIQVFTAILTTVMFCSVILAQEPVVNIDKSVHPNLAQAQEHLVQANRYLVFAQKDNKYDMQGHDQKARDLLAQANHEIKLAADAANAAIQKKK